jgi:hypothetical protein
MKRVEDALPLRRGESSQRMILNHARTNIATRGVKISHKGFESEEIGQNQSFHAFITSKVEQKKSKKIIRTSRATSIPSPLYRKHVPTGWIIPG